MATDEALVYEFGDFRLDVRERRLLQDGQPIPLTTKVFETLRVLLERSGQLLTKDELMQHIWPDAVVEENNLNHNISVLRRALGERRTGPRFIETVPRVGYRFVAAVTQSAPRPGSGSRRRPPVPPGPFVRRSVSAPPATARASPIPPWGQARRWQRRPIG
jgi:DNA-binding winged helix-turn-helix (wHTH) protein